MTRELLEQRLHQLEEDVLALGSMVEQAALDVMKSLRKRDTAAARKIIANDSTINRRRFAIEEDCLAVIATQQPAAHDLRMIAAVFEVITELERMGDYVKGIANIITMLGPEPLPPDLLDHFDTMSTRATAMLHRALGAFTSGDAKLAREIPSDDDEVDRLYNQIYRDLISQMIANPDSIDHATKLLWVAHNLERFADRVSNICERTVFTATGELMEISSSSDGAG